MPPLECVFGQLLFLQWAWFLSAGTGWN